MTFFPSFRDGRLFGVRRCNRCCLPLGSNELVMRARDAVFHLACFTCAACNQVTIPRYTIICLFTFQLKLFL
jgi:LIM domain